MGGDVVQILCVAKVNYPQKNETGIAIYHDSRPTTNLRMWTVAAQEEHRQNLLHH